MGESKRVKGVWGVRVEKTSLGIEDYWWEEAGEQRLRTRERRRPGGERPSYASRLAMLIIDSFKVATIRLLQFLIIFEAETISLGSIYIDSLFFMLEL
jgi:hypothetical protein